MVELGTPVVRLVEEGFVLLLKSPQLISRVGFERGVEFTFSSEEGSLVEECFELVVFVGACAVENDVGAEH